MGFSWPWVTGFAILGFTANVVFLIGCISPPTHMICLWRVEVALLADSLQNIALVDGDGGNQTEILLSPELPTYWYFGMAGICDVFETTGEKRCRRQFPPTKNLLGILEDSLRDPLSDDQEQLTNILSSWNATLNNISPDRLAAKEAKFTAQLKASAALAILAIVLDFATPFIPICVQGRGRFILPLVSSLIAFAAGAIAAVSMSDGVHGVVDTSEHGGPAIMILFVGAALRLLSSGGLCCCCSSRKNNDAYRDSESPRADHELGPKPGMPLAGQPKMSRARKREIGFRGEDHVYTWLEDQLPNWSLNNWTSELRTLGGHPDFTENQSKYADFTYDDHSERMFKVLKNAGVPVSPSWSARTTYHLEVKATTAGRDGNAQPFFVSENQVRLMKRYEGDPLNAYLLVRVFHVEGRPTMRFFLNPRSNQELRWGPPNDEGDYPVYVRS